METTNRPQLAQEFSKKAGATFPIVLDDKRESSKLWGIRGTPTSIFIDPNGKIISRKVGFSPGGEKDLVETVEAMLRRAC